MAKMWLEHSSQQLALRRCAYWQSLRDAPPTTNESGVMVKLPISQEFNAQALETLAARAAHTQLSKISWLMNLNIPIAPTDLVSLRLQKYVSDIEIG